MVEYKTIFFWLGGVLTDPLYKLTASVLAPGVEGQRAVEIWDAVRIRADALALGKITAIEYCAHVAEITDSSLAAPEIELRLLEAINLHQGVISLIDEIPEKYECRLISDFPPPWVQVIEGSSSRIPFPGIEVDYTCDLNSDQMFPDIYYALQKKNNRTKKECLVVDGSSHRSVEAVKNDFSSITYVYPARLKLELVLQGILVEEREVLHPQSAERVEI